MEGQHLNEFPFLSVVIPCREEARALARCLNSVLVNSYPRDRMEVLVIDGGSPDGTRQVISQYQHRDSRVRLLENPEGITPYALNYGIRAARGEVIARVDAHATIAPDYLERCVDNLSNFGASNVGGVRRTVARDTTWFSTAIVVALSHRFGVGNAHFRLGSPEKRWVDTVFGGCWKREIFDRVGLFNPQLRRSQDIEFNLRLKAAGGRTLLDPTIRCDYFARTRFREFWRHSFTDGEWAVLPFLFSRIVPVAPRHLAPLLFALALSCGVLALPWTPWFFAFIAAPHAALNLVVSSGLAWRERSPSLLLSLPIVFLALHLSYGLGSMWGVFQAFQILRRRGLLPPDRNSCQPLH